MSTTLLASMAIPALVIILFILARIATRLYDIHIDLCHIHEDLVRFCLKVKEVKPTKPTRKREYWKDQNGFRHWRKKKDA